MVCVCVMTEYCMCVCLCASTLCVKGLPSPMAFPVWASNRKTTEKRRKENNMNIIRCLNGLHVKSLLALQLCPTFRALGLSYTVWSTYNRSYTTH